MGGVHLYAKRILKLWGQVFFYSVTIFAIFTLFGASDLSIKSIIKVFFPITFETWWFASTYFVLYLMHPFLNRLLLSLDKKTYQKMLMLLILCFSIIPTFTTELYESNNLLWFMTLYSIAGYIRLYGLNRKLTIKHYFILFVIFSLLTYLSSVVFLILGTKWSVFAKHITYFYGQEKINILLISVMLFMTFANLKMGYHKWINIIASATFGVYLIHDNGLARDFLWKTLFKNSLYQNTIMLIPYSIVVVIIVYVVCTLIDLLRQKLFEKPYMCFINHYLDCWLNLLRKIYNFFVGIIFG